MERFLCRKPSRMVADQPESQGMFNLGKICQNSEAKIWKPTYRHQPVLWSLIKHAVSANQSARYMETLS